MTDPEESTDPEYVNVRFNLTQEAYERLWTASAHEFDSLTDTLNRAVKLYEMLLAAEVGQVIRWEMGDGSQRRVVILTNAPALAVTLVERERWTDALPVLVSVGMVVFSALKLADNPWWFAPFGFGLSGVGFWLWFQHRRTTTVTPGLSDEGKP